MRGLLVALAACTGPAESGGISVESPSIAGYADYTFLVFVDLAPWTIDPLGSFCGPIDGDPDVVTGTLSEMLTQPCDPGAALDLEAGDYHVFGGVYEPGQTSPLRCTASTVAVDGDVFVSLPDLTDCP